MLPFEVGKSTRESYGYLLILTHRMPGAMLAVGKPPESSRSLDAIKIIKWVSRIANVISNQQLCWAEVPQRSNQPRTAKSARFFKWCFTSCGQLLQYRFCQTCPGTVFEICGSAAI